MNAKNFAIAALTALALCVAPAAKADDKGCSNASLQGSFADKDIGWVILGPNTSPVPFAGVNSITFDGNGNMTATGWGSFGGSTAAQNEVGTYKVNPDCTGTYAVTIDPNTPDAMPAHAFFVIDDNLNELQIIVIDAGNVITCVARRQFSLGDWRN
jgi:hypothetical protein